MSEQHLKRMPKGAHTYVLVKDTRAEMLPYRWFVDDKLYKAEGRNDGMIYVRGFKTQEEAEKWFKGWKGIK